MKGHRGYGNRMPLPGRNRSAVESSARTLKPSPSSAAPQKFVEGPDGLEGGSFVGPAVWFGGFVVRYRVCLQLVDQVIAAGEVAVPQNPAGQGGEEQFDMVEPGSVRRGPADVPAWAAGQVLVCRAGSPGRAGCPGWRRERAAITVFSSMDRTTAPSGDARWRTHTAAARCQKSGCPGE